MKTLVLLPVLTVSLMGGQLATPPGLVAQVQTMHIRNCSRADTLFGRLWRSHPTRVRLAWRGDTAAISPPVRTVSWATTSSRLVGTEAVALLPRRDMPSDSTRIELNLRFLDSIVRAPEQALLDLQIGDSLRVQVTGPRVDYPMVKASGIPVVVTAVLTPEQSLALARASKVTGTMGPYPFYLYRWELWDINAIYRATVCGVE